MVKIQATPSFPQEKSKEQERKVKEQKKRVRNKQKTIHKYECNGAPINAMQE